MALKYKKCGHCGAGVPESYTECNYCGKSLESVSAAGTKLESTFGDAPVTKIVMGVCIAVLLAESLLAGGYTFISPSIYTSIHFGANFAPYILEGEVWRLVTANFLHGDLVHIGFNLYGLWSVGPLLERSFGATRYWFAIIATGIVATVASFAWHLGGAQLGLASGSIFAASVGLSGALCGLIGLGVAAGHKVKNQVGRNVRNQLLSWMGMLAVFGFLVPGVDNAAHFGGFLGGLALGFVLPLKGAASELSGRIYQGLAALGVAAVLGSFAAQVSTWEDYPADYQAYHQTLFSFKLRNDDPQLLDDVINDCRRAAFDSEGDPADAIRLCRYASRLVPVSPEPRVRLAQVYAQGKQPALACKEARYVRMIDGFGGQLNSAGQAMVDAIIENQCKN